MSKLYVVGIGPGNKENMTLAAIEALEDSEIILGYKTYISILKEFFPNFNYRDSSMFQELDRCKQALALAENKNVALVCSGDSSVYGMAGPVYELSKKYDNVDIVVIPGVTASSSASALVGSPLTNDYAVVSLSDLLTPWEKIESRIRSVGIGDFVVCLYNPMSKGRRTQLGKACKILLEYKSPDTLCAVAHLVGRKGESYKLLSLSELVNTDVDMVSTVIIGNSQSINVKGKMVNKRGYESV